MKEPLHTDPAIEEREGARFVNESGNEVQQYGVDYVNCGNCGTPKAIGAECGCEDQPI